MKFHRLQRAALGATLLAGLVGAATISMAASNGGNEHSDQAFTVALWGDMPYIKGSVAWTTEQQVSNLIADVNSEKVDFSIFDGDLKSGSSFCDNSQYSAAVARFNAFKAPAVYVLGDNEWTDCHRKNNAAAAPGYNALERLAYIRSTMFNSEQSFGQKTMTLEHQGPLGQPYSENTRWVKSGVVFVALNIPGSNNNVVHAGECISSASYRTQADCDADNAEYAARNAKNLEWLASSFDLAREIGAPGIMLIIQANPGFDSPDTGSVNERLDPAVDGYTATLNALQAETLDFDGEVVLVHGDSHYFRVDKPMLDPSNPAGGPFRVVENFTRLETFGESNADWVRVTVDPNSRGVFSFEPMIVAANH